MFNLDIFKLPKRYTDLEKKLAEARGLGNCQGYITGHNGAEACWALALEHRISIIHPDVNLGVTIGFNDEYGNFLINDYEYSDFEHPELAVRYGICDMVIRKITKDYGNLNG